MGGSDTERTEKGMAASDECWYPTQSHRLCPEDPTAWFVLVLH